MTNKPVILPVGPEQWSDFERLFESPGAPKYCWCMVRRMNGTEARTADKAVRKRAMEARVLSKVPVGLLAYVEGEAVAWCSVAPRPTFKALGGPDDHIDAPGAVWSLTCFFVKRTHRCQGMADALLAAAVRHAQESGAEVLEAYPVDPESPSYRFMGFVPQFEKYGFTEVGRAGKRRHVYRLAL